MDGPSDRIAYLREHPIRAQIALACRDEPATKAQIAKRLGREPGSLTAIDTLERKGVLRRLRSGRRGARVAARWHLEQRWHGAAEAAIEEVKVGILSAGIDLILVPASDVAAACGLFLSPHPKISWGAPLRGEQLGLMLCPRGEGEGPALHLLAELTRCGARPLRLRLPEVLDSEELASWAAGVGGERQLTSGS